MLTNNDDNNGLEPSPSKPEYVAGRIPGCQSTNHTECYGDLWTCADCGKQICHAEGTDHHYELCDDCWVQRFPRYSTSTAPIGATWDNNCLQITCDCAAEEPCGTRLQLMLDGILVIEDRDNSRLSFALPDWLDAAIRYALQRQHLQVSASPRLTIVLESGGVERMTLPYVTATLRDLFDNAVWVAHINDLPLQEVTIRFTTDAVVTPSPTMVPDDAGEIALSDDVPF